MLLTPDRRICISLMCFSSPPLLFSSSLRLSVDSGLVGTRGGAGGACREAAFCDTKGEKKRFSIVVITDFLVNPPQVNAGHLCRRHSDAS